MNPASATTDRLQVLRATGAPERDPVGWHYLQTLASRTAVHSGTVQALLQDKLDKAIEAFEMGLQASPRAPAQNPPPPASALARLLEEMPQHRIRDIPASAPGAAASRPPGLGMPPENPQVRQFRRQLRKISVQKQVREAIAQAPENAGPINSHRLVLNALALMRDIAPDYLDRFMVHVDTLLWLEEAERARLQPKKSPPAGKK